MNNNNLPFYAPNGMDFPNQNINPNININMNIRNLEDRVYQLEREVSKLKNKISKLENTPTLYSNDNYSSNYQPNIYNMM